jgi:hypothetical protein
MKAAPMIRGIEKMNEFNATLGVSLKESSYPSLGERRAVARKVEAWTLDQVRQPRVNRRKP